MGRTIVKGPDPGDLSPGHGKFWGLGLVRVPLRSHNCTMVYRLVFALILLCPMGLGSTFQPAPAQSPGVDAIVPEWSLRDLLRRDQRVSFPPRAGQRARLDLKTGNLTQGMRAAALFTLGETHTSSGRAHAELGMLKGSIEERCAAVTAWGDMGSLLDGEDPFLVDRLGDADLPVAEAALLALYSNTPGHVLDRLAFLVANPDQPLFTAAESILQWHERGTCDAPGPISRRLEMRWKAALVYGTVQGQVWSSLLMDQLAADVNFVDRSLLMESGTVRDPRVRDHLLEWLLGNQTEEVPALAALIAMPGALDSLVESGLWAPQTGKQMESILQVAEDRGLARLIPGTLARLALHPDYTLRVSGWLVGVDSRYQEVVEGSLLSPDAAIRGRAVRAAGQAGLPEWVVRLRDMSRDPHLDVRMEALIARVREGDQELAWRPLRGMFVDERAEFTDADRDRLTRIMLAAHNSRVLDLVSFIRTKLPYGVERTRLSTILLAGGRGVTSDDIRDSLKRSLGGEFWDLKMIEALGYSSDAKDRLFLEEVFPRQGSSEINVALARALLRSGSEDVIPLLKHTVWTGTFNRSCLAGILVAQKFGPLRLMQWLERPPVEATAQDLRRLGFIVGSLGGKQAVDLLARHLGSVAGAERPELQGAMLGALSARTY